MGEGDHVVAGGQSCAACGGVIPSKLLAAVVAQTGLGRLEYAVLVQVDPDTGVVVVRGDAEAPDAGFGRIDVKLAEKQVRVLVVLVDCAGVFEIGVVVEVQPAPARPVGQDRLPVEGGALGRVAPAHHTGGAVVVKVHHAVGTGVIAVVVEPVDRVVGQTDRCQRRVERNVSAVDFQVRGRGHFLVDDHGPAGDGDGAADGVQFGRVRRNVEIGRARFDRDKPGGVDLLVQIHGVAQGRHVGHAGNRNVKVRPVQEVIDRRADVADNRTAVEDLQRIDRQGRRSSQNRARTAHFDRAARVYRQRTVGAAERMGRAVGEDQAGDRDAGVVVKPAFAVKHAGSENLQRIGHNLATADLQRAARVYRDDTADVDCVDPEGNATEIDPAGGARDSHVGATQDSIRGQCASAVHDRVAGNDERCGGGECVCAAVGERQVLDVDVSGAGQHPAEHLQLAAGGVDCIGADVQPAAGQRDIAVGGNVRGVHRAGYVEARRAQRGVNGKDAGSADRNRGPGRVQCRSGHVQGRVDGQGTRHVDRRQCADRVRPAGYQ